jgi:hypothetical protein
MFFSNKSKFYTLLKIFADINYNIINNLFFGNIINTKEFREQNKKYIPLLLSQFTSLYHIDKLRYKNKITQPLLDFFGRNFKNNVVFITCDEGFLLYILVMQTDTNDRKLINDFFANNIEELPNYQYYSSEYDPKFDYFKLIVAKTHKNSVCNDIILYFH